MHNPLSYKGLLMVAFGLGLSAFCLSDKASAQINPIKSGIIENLISVESPLLIRAGITSALDAGRLGHLKFKDTPGMKAFYEARGFELAWIQNSFFQQQKAQVILSVLENSWTHGLNPNQYHIKEIRQLMDETKGDERFQLDLVISDALVRYGQDMSAMRVNPKRIGQRSRYWRKPLRGIDILDHVASHSNARSALGSLSPKGKLYKTLQEELIRLYKTPKEVKGTKIRLRKGVLRPGTSNKAVLSVRKRMGFDVDSKIQGHYFYDDTLAKSVMAFQKAHGLKPDGIIGRQTIKLMNITREDKINQVLVNLERLRWVEQSKPNRYIMVNVPSARLWAIENGKVKIEMPVVVGRPKRPTNIFSTKISGIRYNPTWTVPPTIKREDYLPKLRQNPYYLSDRGIELMKGSMTVDPGQIDWNSKTWAEVNNMRMVQGSGSRNPLGKVRFLMDNPFNIYLHDTNTKSYFKRSDRALSSGCIRLEKPVELADFVLKSNTDWSPARRDKILKSGRLTEIYAQEQLPIYVLYQTVWLGDRGQIIYGADLYNHDSRLIKALSEVGGVAIPVAPEAVQTVKKTVQFKVN